VAAICPLEWSPARILEQVRRAGWITLEGLAPALLAIAVHQQRVSGSRRQRRSAARAIRRLASARHRRGLGVALLGPDGAGKSTLIAGIQQTFIFPVRPV